MPSEEQLPAIRFLADGLAENVTRGNYDEYGAMRHLFKTALVIRSLITEGETMSRTVEIFNIVIYEVHYPAAVGLARVNSHGENEGILQFAIKDKTFDPGILKIGQNISVTAQSITGPQKFDGRIRTITENTIGDYGFHVYDERFNDQNLLDGNTEYM